MVFSASNPKLLVDSWPYDWLNGFTSISQSILKRSERSS